MVLTEWDRLVAHENVIEERVVILVERLLEPGFYKRIVVDCSTGTILNGQHKTAAAGRTGPELVPVLPVDYLLDGRVVDVWPVCGRVPITKVEVAEMAGSCEVFPPKTSRHVVPLALPRLAVPLEQLGLSVH